VRLKAKKPPDPAYPNSLESLGDHIRKRRLELGLLHKDVAKMLGVTLSTIWNWENRHTEPHISFRLRIVNFLGYALWGPTQNGSQVKGSSRDKHQQS
jgi:transcriptional regulator with XRE-family HTH domain